MADLEAELQQFAESTDTRIAEAARQLQQQTARAAAAEHSRDSIKAELQQQSAALSSANVHLGLWRAHAEALEGHLDALANRGVVVAPPSAAAAAAAGGPIGGHLRIIQQLSARLLASERAANGLRNDLSATSAAVDAAVAAAAAGAGIDDTQRKLMFNAVGAPGNNGQQPQQQQRASSVDVSIEREAERLAMANRELTEEVRACVCNMMTLIVIFFSCVCVSVDH